MGKYRVKSDTDKNIKYIVQHFPETDKFVCECPAYSFRKKESECKHIKKVRAYLKKKHEQTN